MGSHVQIVPYKPEYATFFEQLNKAWIQEHFIMEPVDYYVLENPQEAILNKGGVILFALFEEKVIGTVALAYVRKGVFELTKMAVDERFRGIGAGRILCEAALKKAADLNANEVILYSNTKLTTAINLYRKIGFVELPLEHGLYDRADIKMGISMI
ncbi:MAG TPA: GNAT family N-acetyltransferase [Flavobacterium sp.]|jgi:ribosomal protein S18 acetylase RimI-like enzyme